MPSGTLYGIGVGPGDPELITLKGIKVLGYVDVVFAASSTKNRYSLAVNIASRYLRKDTPVELLGFPMTRDPEKLKEAWRENALRVMKPLKEGKNVAFLTLGDPLTYSTFGYVMQTLRREDPNLSIKIVPGITSYQAAAAAAGWVLAEAEESLAVISGVLGAERLKEVVDSVDSIVMLKVYRRYEEILLDLEELGLLGHSVLVSNCGREGEKIVRDLKKHRLDDLGYLSLLLIKKPNKVKHP